MSNQSRRPAGTPSGGQFAQSSHDETDIELSEDRAAERLEELAQDIAETAETASQTRTVEEMEELTAAVEAANNAVVDKAKARQRAAKLSAALGVPIRGELDVLDEPLTPAEVGCRIDDDGWVDGYIRLDMSEMVDGDLERHLDTISERLVGSPLLHEPAGEPSRIEDGEIVFHAAGRLPDDFADDYWDDDEREAFDAGRAASAALRVGQTSGPTTSGT